MDAGSLDVFFRLEFECHDCLAEDRCRCGGGAFPAFWFGLSLEDNRTSWRLMQDLCPCSYACLCGGMLVIVFTAGSQ